MHDITYTVTLVLADGTKFTSEVHASQRSQLRALHTFMRSLNETPGSPAKMRIVVSKVPKKTA